MTDIEQYVYMQTLAEELQEYAELDGSEIGETCMGLIHLSHYVSYVSPEFRDALIKELEAQLEDFKENTVIEVRTETLSRKIKTLEWIG